ncbi:endolytic transglycosylase MltG [Paracoccus aerodenitrificans]|uniref:endolytic transglycosylase MltG n=1 Tax=Paracoccus aerodenitrificans TaxID=3017781 RepID=UPI0022F0F66F|nr:endolytic transglycosylase MltG [Paracoccus aerodenitrificans]WBU65331.1 endolytic transglycosylase MltG [Paracoccus aerodenitrificans]
MWKNIVSNFLTLAIVILIAVAGAIAWGRAQYSGAGPSQIAQCVQIARGASLAAVSKQLEGQGAISNAYIFRAGADAAGKSRELKFGSYLVQPEASMEDIVGVITEGGPSTCGTEVIYRIGVRADSVVLRDINPQTGQYEERVKYDPAVETKPQPIADAEDQPDARLRVAIAEGVTSWQIVEGLKRADFMSGEISEVPDEGSLAPDSYEVARGEDRGELLDLMEERQAAILQAAWDARLFGLPYDSPEEALIMASIVEKETGIAEEREVVASVFVNRLEQGMRLETDPTVIYGVTEGRGVLDRGLRRSELDTRTDWNTYQIDGLPPTPIANPGRAAIQAALNPAQTDYIFFVADGSGGHAFARTLEEHNANVARWREIEAERAAGQPTTGG